MMNFFGIEISDERFDLAMVAASRGLGDDAVSKALGFSPYDQMDKLALFGLALDDRTAMLAGGISKNNVEIEKLQSEILWTNVTWLVVFAAWLVWAALH